MVQPQVLAIGAPPGRSGARVESIEAQPALQPSPFGTTAVAGAYQWGPAGLASHSGEPDYKAMRGSAFAEDHAALMCEHFLEMARGAGTLYTVRLSDDNDRQSELSVYCRDVDTDRTLLSQVSQPTRAVLLKGAYKGRRGGARLLAAGRKANLGASFSTAGTFDVSTDFAMQVDEFKGATLKMDGVSRSYRVTGNDADGVLVIEVPPGDTGPGAVAGGWWLVLDSPDAWNQVDGLSAKVDTAGRNPTSEFDLTMFDQRNGAGLDPKYESVSLDATEDSDVTAKMLADFMVRAQYWMLATGDPDTAIGDFTADEMRPANLAAMPLPATGDGTRAIAKLVTPAKANLIDGETFTLPDGRNAAVVFEFDTDGAITSGNRQVDISAAATADDVAALMVTAINAAFVAKLGKWFAFQNGITGGVTVLGQAGQVANVTITETVADVGFTVTGFASGVGPTNYVDLETFQWTKVGTGDPYPDPASISYPTDSRHKMRAVCTFTAPTAFTVDYETWDGTFTIADSAALPVGATGTAYAPGGNLLPRFLLYAGGVAAVAGDIVTIYFAPLAVDVRTLDGLLYPHAHDQGFGSTNDIGAFFRVVSNTVNRVTLAASTDLGTDHAVCYPGRPMLISKAGTFNLAGAETFIYDPFGAGAVTLTQTLVGAAVTAAALAVELNTQELAAHADVALMHFYATDDDELVAEATYDTGESAAWELTTGTLNVILGLEDNTDAYGSEGTPVALSYAEPLYGGRDGYGELGEGTEYLDAFDTDTSPLNALSALDVGCVKVALPGVSGSTGEPEQNRADEYCRIKGHMFRGEIDPTSATTETSVKAYVRANFDGSRYRSMMWDSYGAPHRLPYRNAGVTYVPMTGAILGIEARQARDEDGYHKAVAGPKASVHTLFKYGASMEGLVGEQVPKREEILNPAGIQTVQHRGRLIFPNGGRNSDLNYVGTTWKHKVECLVHMMHQVRYAGDQLAWEGLDPESRNIAANQVRPLFKPLWDADWFVNEDGVDFLEGIRIAVGPDENPPIVQVLGQLRMVITTLPLVGTAERIVIALGSGGVSALF